MNPKLPAPLVIVLAGVFAGLPSSGAAQEPPPVTGTVALEGTVDKTYAAANAVIVKAADGIEHLFHLTRHTVVHGAGETGDAALDGLKEGSRVVVHSAIVAGEATAIEIDRLGEDGLQTVTGVVTRVDRASKTLSVRLADGTVETLRLSDRAAVDVGKDVDREADNDARVLVYYTNEAGDKVAHFFKKIS